VRAQSHSEHGAAAIEFAISAVVLFMLIFGCIGVCVAFYTYEVINQYARDASRYAIVHGNGCVIETAGKVGTSCSIGTGATANSALKSYLNHQVFPGINGNNLILGTTYAHGPAATSCNVQPGCNGAGDQVTVVVSYAYLYALPFVPQRNFTMYGRSTMVISQ
jgi:Flp pilus assembly protein TadG